MNQFDLISDTHIDFWVNIDSDQEKMKKKLTEFTKRLLPNNPSEILVIAGDLGHYNKQNIMFLNILKETYKHILLVEGNHDLYLVSGKINKKYQNNSLNRVNDMKKMTSEIEGVYYLDGNIININGIKFGGTGMWYDFTYGMKVLNLSRGEVFEAWEEYMNDSIYIRGVESRPYQRFKSEKEKLEKIVYDSDVIITHIGPDWSKIPNKYKDDVCTSFYFFDGSAYLEKLQGKIWCFGHIHERYDYYNGKCRMINASLGYPDEKVNNRKIVNICITNDNN